MSTKKTDELRAAEVLEAEPRVTTVPEAGRKYLGLERNAAYRAAQLGVSQPFESAAAWSCRLPRWKSW